MDIVVHEREFLRARVPGYLERSLQHALAGVAPPFFTYREGAVVIVVVERQEWEHLAPRFPAAAVTTGYRLVVVTPPGSDPAFPARLRRALAGGGIEAQLLPSFHNDYVLVRAADLDRCLALITALPDG